MADASLIYSIIGEIGNNTFDHNLGMWSDQPGCYFESIIDSTGIQFAMADRGRGLYSSLSRVSAEIQNDQQAIETAFQKVLSGRAPEQRGNGLKFVRGVINGHPSRALVAKSGSGIYGFGGDVESIEKLTEQLENPGTAPGMIVMFKWSRS